LVSAKDKVTQCLIVLMSLLVRSGL